MSLGMALRPVQALGPVLSLQRELVRELLAVVPRLHWRDGRTTAQGVAASVKSCEVAETYGDAVFSSDEGAELLGRLHVSLLRDEGFIATALPARLSALRFMRYGVGGEYGVHTDETLNAMGFRADLSFTILLQEAELGGALVVGGAPVPLLEGDVFVYPSTTAHGVTRVEAGERIVVVGWVQSQVRDHGKRALLAELHRMSQHPAECSAPSIQAVRNELLRRWC